ncbi:MAG TPA: hypothetical protein PLY88_04965 [Candidatus Omnitrophota bacterium]|nr:hypothetical protein [Candidatus Omnitrophota bacterium]
MRSLSAKLIFSLLICVCCSSFSAHASDDPLADIDRQRAFVAQFDEDLEKEKLRKEAERQAEEQRRQALKKRRDEARLSAQFAGLSKKLSGLPDLPAFKGQFMPERNIRVKKDPEA